MNLFSPYILHLVTLIAIYGIIAMSFNLTMGMAGILNFSHIALVGIGAYLSAILTVQYGYPMYVGGIAAVVGGAFASGILGLLIRRVRGDFMAVITLLCAIVVYEVLVNWQEVTRGALGIAGIPRPWYATSQLEYAVLAVVVCVLTFAVLHRVAASPFGRVLGAMRDDAIGAVTTGKDIAHVKRTVLLLSGAIAGGAGALYAHFVQFIDPPSFYLLDLVLVVSAVVIGGLGSFVGSIIGVTIFFLLPEALRYIQIDPDIVGAVRQIIFSVLLLVVIILRPRGLFGKVDLSE